ncbi:TetR/AcrR family transcriptional regulator [Planktotalea sp.]|uniref:TetR/AcrR family transcriptional regulator n=1 Tax=Planktotalea sp. TaxID=2029877 RepID=UPI003D6C6585
MNLQNTAIRRGRKFDQVLQGARTVFLAEGFSASNMDYVAKESGVSKATLYSYFPDKESLFVNVVQSECARQADYAMEHIDQSAPAAQVLTNAGRHLLGFITSEFGQRMFRICIAEADRFPELGIAFYESGPLVVKQKIGDYLTSASDSGELAIEDTDLAADQFAELCKADIFPKMLFGVQTDFSSQDIDRVVTSAVTTFLARYAVKTR